MAYRRKEKNQILAKQLIVKKKLGLQDLRELVDKFQTLKEIISKHFNLRVKWRDKQFKVIVDSRVTRNYIILKTVKRLGILYKKKVFISVSYNFRRINSL